MKKIKYKYDETIYEEKLPNGFRIYLYNTNKTKNFYISVSTRFGASTLKYKKSGKTYDIPKGSAHFLEHRVMDFTKNKEAMKKIDQYGSMPNAYTTYNGTNYNIFGTENIMGNIEILLDCVFKAKIKKEDVENERGIILEEYNMYFDDPYFVLETNLYKNMYNSLFIKYPVLGTTEGIQTVTSEELTRIYEDFYTPDNMFMVITGSFNENEVIEYITNYMKNIKGKFRAEKIETEGEEKYEVSVNYEEIKWDVNEPKVVVGYKMKIPKNADKKRITLGIKLALSNLFSSTGDAREELSKIGIKRTQYSIEKIKDYISITFVASTDKTEDFLRIVEENLKNIKIDAKSLKRKIIGNKSNLILEFEDITNIEEMICSSIFANNKLNNKREEKLDSLSVNEINKWLKTIDINNKSVLKIIK